MATPHVPSAFSRVVAWAPGLIVVAVLAAYHNSLHGPFVFDDASSIVTNPTIRHLWPLTDPLSPPTSNVTAQGRPLLNLSLAVNHAISGTEVWSYHVLNVLIHACAALTLFGVIRRALRLPRLAAQWGRRADGIALVVASLWAVHPLQTESVTYVIQRAESLMGLCYLLTVYAFLRAVEAAGPAGADVAAAGSSRRSRRWWFAGVAACAAGMATKEVMVTAPLMILLLDVVLVSGTGFGPVGRRAGWHAALFSTWLLLGWLVLQTGGNRGGSVGFGVGVAWWDYGLTQFRAVAHYLVLALWPSSLVFEYGTFWITNPADVAVEAAVLLGLLGLTITGLARRHPLSLLGAWFLGILAPTSLAPGTTQMIVEHRLYLPLAAVIFAAVLGVARAGAGRSARVVAALAAALVLVSVALTVRRNHDYRSEVALWQDTLAKRPGNPLAHFMLAGAWERQGETARALAGYEEMLRLKPDFSVGREHFGELLLKLGCRAEAIIQFEAALKLQPEYADAHANLGIALAGDDRMQAAIEHLETAARLAPGSAEIPFNLGNVLAAAGRRDDAIAAFLRAAQLNPGVPEVQFNLANAFAEQGRLADAARHYEAALALRSAYPAAHYNLANLLARSGRQAQAVPHYEAALRDRPDYAEAHHNLAGALLELGRPAESVPHYEATLRLAPDFPQARANLERARRALAR